MSENIKFIIKKVRDHIKNQPVKAQGKEVKCYYRLAVKGSDKPLKCWVGALIPDDKYDPCFESIGSITDIALTYGREKLAQILDLPHDIDDDDMDLLIQLQSVHDNIPTDQWTDRLDLLENQFVV